MTFDLKTDVEYHDFWGTNVPILGMDSISTNSIKHIIKIMECHLRSDQGYRHLKKRLIADLRTQSYIYKNVDYNESKKIQTVTNLITGIKSTIDVNKIKRFVE